MGGFEGTIVTSVPVMSAAGFYVNVCVFEKCFIRNNTDFFVASKNGSNYV